MGLQGTERAFPTIPYHSQLKILEKISDISLGADFANIIRITAVKNI